MHSLFNDISTSCCATVLPQAQDIVPATTVQFYAAGIKPVVKWFTLRLPWKKRPPGSRWSCISLKSHRIPATSCACARTRLRRAGLDYRDRARVIRHSSFEDCREHLGQRRWLAFTTRGRRYHSDWGFSAGDVLLFGPETRGLPQSVLDQIPVEQWLCIPQLPDARSLNLGNAAAVGVYEAWRQIGYAE
jgi:tRNA (cytidine/uridine-2'-O-)-methyltransferase